jgi:hypothetical protein
MIEGKGLSGYMFIVEKKLESLKVQVNEGGWNFDMESEVTTYGFHDLTSFELDPPQIC